MDEDEARAVLGIGPDVGRDEAHDSYLRRARLLHPDVQPPDPGLQSEADRAMQQLNEAWFVLRRSAWPAAEVLPGEGSTASGPSDLRVPAPNDAAEPAPGHAAPTGGGDLLWPEMPTEVEVHRMVAEQLAKERFVGPDSITGVTEVTGASIATWRLSSLVERRSESWSTFPNEFAPPDAALYDVALNAVALPDPSGRNEHFTRYRTGTLSREACPDCQGGTRRCQTCSGAGSTSCRTTTVCSECHGSGRVTPVAPYGAAASGPVAGQVLDERCPACGGRGKVACPRCAGTGRVPCETCAGRGRVPCETCQGSGELTRVLVGTVDRTWQSDSEPGYGPQALAAEAAQLADGYTQGVQATVVDPRRLAPGLPQPVVAALPRLMSRAPAALRSQVEISVIPTVRAAATGRDGTQTVWLIGLPPKLVAPATEEHRLARRNRWLTQMATRGVAAVAAAVLVGSVLTRLVATPLAVVLAVLVALLVGVLLARPQLEAARIGSLVDENADVTGVGGSPDG